MSCDMTGLDDLDTSSLKILMILIQDLEILIHQVSRSGMTDLDDLDTASLTHPYLNT